MARAKKEETVESNVIVVKLKEQYKNMSSVITERGILYFNEGKLTINKNELDSIKEYVE